MEKCQHSIKSTVKKIKSQIQKGANPEKAAKRGYEEVAKYMDFWNKTVLVQHRALTCLSKSLVTILAKSVHNVLSQHLLYVFIKLFYIEVVYTQPLSSHLIVHLYSLACNLGTIDNNVKHL